MYLAIIDLTPPAKHLHLYVGTHVKAAELNETIRFFNAKAASVVGCGRQHFLKIEKDLSVGGGKVDVSYADSEFIFFRFVTREVSVAESRIGRESPPAYAPISKLNNDCRAKRKICFRIFAPDLT